MLPLVQIYASYKYRRDLVEAVKLPGMLGRSRAVTSSEADAQVAHFHSLFSVVKLATVSISCDLSTESMFQPPESIGKHLGLEHA